MRGGLRSRLVVDSVRVTLLAGLIDLGWFDSTIFDTPPGPRRHQPLRYIPRPASWDVELQPNALSVTLEIMVDDPRGFGAEVEDSLSLYVDLFAQDDELGWQLAHDIEDILLGRQPDIGRAGPVIDVWDLQQATPVPFVQVDVENVRIDRAQGQTQDWQRHWFMIRCDLIDEYGDEAGVTFTPSPWGASSSDAWARMAAT
jgi:hypothetical protein